jgi:Putative restriction endonuclease
MAQNVTDTVRLDPYAIGYWEGVPIPNWLSGGLMAQIWDAFPESLCKRIEAVDGRVIYMTPPPLRHQVAVGMIAASIGREVQACGEPVTVLPFFDLRFDNDPLHHRKPDVIVYRDYDEERWPRPQDTVLVVAGWHSGRGAVPGAYRVGRTRLLAGRAGCRFAYRFAR